MSLDYKAKAVKKGGMIPVSGNKIESMGTRQEGHFLIWNEAGRI